METRPANAVTIIECDMNVEFAPPLDYVEPERPKRDEEMAVDEDEPAGFVAFKGQGNRLDGKKKKDSSSKETVATTSKTPRPRGIPDYEHPYGLIRFDRSIRPISDGPDPKKEEEEKTAPSFEAFSGQGFSLKKNKK